ncbi:MAG TPA: DUF1844 domain-containing protein [Pyrinomonadaceae bacterium]|jgi:hypothetical protein|nr:DUF1844 domain-containing protein [Pyrinomonadaceae bacterium]
MNEEQTSYKVTDRRLFNPDGTPRDVPENEKPEPAPAKSEPASTPPISSEPPANVITPSAPDEVPAPATAAAEPTSPEVEQGLEIDEAELGAEDPASFASFMMSIASNAASSLGMMEHPVTHKREVDLELGKHWIDVLGMLERKTRGNLLPQEQQILEGLLADLRMQYVSLTNAAPKARTFTSQDITGG